MLEIKTLGKVKILYCKSLIADGYKELIGKTFNILFEIGDMVVIEYNNENIKLNAGEYEFYKEGIEIWKDIKGYEGLYQVSNLGRVKRLERYTENIKYLPERIMKLTTTQDGYLAVGLTKNKKSQSYLLGRLVYKAFNPNFDEKDWNLLVLQKDGNKLNNELDNLYIERREIICKLKQKEPIICISTGKYFSSIEDACKNYKIFASNVSKCCKRKHESAGKIILDNGLKIKLFWRYLSDEVWKDIIGYEGLYQVSNFGRVKSIERYTTKNCLIKEQIKNTRLTNGVVSVTLSKNGKKKNYSVARILFKAFNPSFDDTNLELEVRHKDNNSLNNELSNLYIEVKSIRKGHEVKFFCTTTKTLFNSLNEAKEYANLKSGSGIVLCCQKKRKHSGKLENGKKLRWKYVNIL